MSDDFRENGHVHGHEDVAVGPLPADLQAIYDRLERDSEVWTRRLPTAEPLYGYLRALGARNATVDEAVRPPSAGDPLDQINLTDNQPVRLAPGGKLGTTHAHQSRRAVWGAASAAVAVVALLAATFALLPHTRGTTGITAATATPSPQATPCVPDQITAAIPSHAQLYQIDMTSPIDGWALGRTKTQVNSDNPSTHPLLVQFHQCHWTPAPDPLPGANADLHDISMATAEDGWATGAESSGASWHCVLLHYTNGQWQRAALPPQMQGPSACDKIQMTSPEEGWLLAQWGGPSGSPLPEHLLHYVKGVWTPVESPIAGIFALATTGSDDVWVAGMWNAVSSDPNQPGGHTGGVDVAHYEHGQWTTFRLSVGAQAWFRMNSSSDGWLVPATLPLQVLHYDGTSWRQSSFSEHMPADGVVTVFDSSDVWTIGLAMSTKLHVTAVQHYVDGQWQTVPWPFPDVFVLTQLTRTAPGEYWTVGVHAYGVDQSTWKSVLLYYAGGAWHEYGA